MCTWANSVKSYRSVCFRISIAQILNSLIKQAWCNDFQTKKKDVFDELDRSEIGSILCFDCNLVRHKVSKTVINTWLNYVWCSTSVGWKCSLRNPGNFCISELEATFQKNQLTFDSYIFVYHLPQQQLHLHPLPVYVPLLTRVQCWNNKRLSVEIKLESTRRN